MPSAAGTTPPTTGSLPAACHPPPARDTADAQCRRATRGSAATRRRRAMMSASYEARPAAPAAQATRWRIPPVVAIAASVDLAFYALAAWIVRRYYQTHLPHFDSMGGYTTS